MSYEILLTNEAIRDLRKLDGDTEKRIIKKLKDLAEYPEHYGKPLKGPQDLWVLKVGRSDWRIIFKIRRDENK